MAKYSPLKADVELLLNDALDDVTIRDWKKCYKILNKGFIKEVLRNNILEKISDSEDEGDEHLF